MDQLKEYALRRLAAVSEHSATLVKALQKKGATQKQIEKIIGEFTQLGYLDDPNWVVQFVRAKKNKFYGPHNIRQKLFAKGIPKDQIDRALEETDDTDPKEAIAHLLATRLSTKEKPKQIAALLRRGFSYSDIFATLK